MTIYLNNNTVNTIRCYLPTQTGYTMQIYNAFTSVTYDLIDVSPVIFNNTFIFDLTGNINTGTTSIILNSGGYKYFILNPDGITIIDRGKVNILGQNPIIPIAKVKRNKIKVVSV